MIQLESERLKIRPINIEDKDAIFAYRSDKDANQFQGFIPETMEEVETFINKNPEEWNISGTWFQLVLLEKSSGNIIGDLGVHFKDEEQVELGITLNKNFQGNGLATEGMQTIIDHLFLKMKKHRIVTSLDPENLASIKLVERLNFRKEAHFKKSIFWKGRWVDDIVYALLAEERN
ncbi:MAG: GNAT family protein [Saprospiraceae bacterium]